MFQLKIKGFDMKTIILILSFVMMTSLSAADDGEVLMRRQRDGNVMETGCDELDDFINNLSKFTKRIVGMFYNGDSSGENDVREDNNPEEHDKNTDRDNNDDGMEDTDRGVQEIDSDEYPPGINGGDAEETGDMIHMDLLPIY